MTDPTGADVTALLDALADPARRAAQVRRAVERPDFAQAVHIACQLGLDGTPRRAGAAIQAAHALMDRRLVPAAVERLLSGAWDAIPDPTQPGATLAASALGFISDVGRPRHADPAVRHALTVPGLRARAWRATTPDHGDAILAQLSALLTEAPALAGPVATRFALLHRDLCVSASAALAAAPTPLKQAFGDALQKHLERVFAIKLWVACRRALFGR